MPGAGTSTQPDNATLYERMEPMTMATVVTDDVPWKLDSVAIEDQLDEEVMIPKPALSKT